MFIELLQILSLCPSVAVHMSVRLSNYPSLWSEEESEKKSELSGYFEVGCGDEILGVRLVGIPHGRRHFPFGRPRYSPDSLLRVIQIH